VQKEKGEDEREEREEREESAGCHGMARVCVWDPFGRSELAKR